MTTTGEQQRDLPAAGRARRRLPRTLALIGLLATAAAGGTWAEVHFAGRIQLDHQASADGVSQDSVGAQKAITGLGVGGAGETQVDEILPPRVSFPDTVTSPAGYQGSRYALSARTTDCGAVFAAAAPAAVTDHCAGYLTADYVGQDDRATYSSVTVLYYPDAATATRVAHLLNAPQNALTDLRFVQPGDGLPMTSSPAGNGASAALDGAAAAGLPLNGATAPATNTTAPTTGTPTPTPSTGAGTQTPPTRDPDNAATQVRVAAVGRAVTVVQSAFADGSPSGPELETPTWYLSYTVASALAWEPDQPPTATSPTP